jgi:hypothetical protein
MSKVRWYWAGGTLLAVLIAGEYFSGFLNLLFLKLDQGQLGWETYCH